MSHNCFSASISIHSLYAEGDGLKFSLMFNPPCISIHSLYAEGDHICKSDSAFRQISIHSLYAEGDFLRPTVSESQTNFNPLPLRRGRRGILPVSVGKRDFNPLPLRRGRPLAMCFSLLNMGYFNPLPLRRGRLKIPCLSNSPLSFQSTPSTQRETVVFLPSSKPLLSISIHSLYAEGDSKNQQNFI